ncbi:hypothetical protein B0H10DRAFT_2238213 [Mycena sp. CBHHK59/15]|nr:hypothetical protein B0H10DRAFT_2238213 [Mycena sp. CBHHK59/15]
MSWSQSGQRYTMSTYGEWMEQGGNGGAPSSPTITPSDGSQLSLRNDDPTQMDPSDFVDSLCDLLELNPKYRSDLHAFILLCGSLSRELVMVMVTQQATNLYTQKLLLDAQANYSGVAEALRDVKTALAKNLELTKDQLAEITAVCKLKVWDPTRTDYDNEALREDVVEHLRKRQQTNGFKAIFESKGHNRMRTLNQAVGRQASYAKTTLRTSIKESITAPTSTCLTITTTTTMRKFTGSTENISPKHAICMAIFRRFGRENPELLVSAESNKRQRTESDQLVNRKGRRGADPEAQWWVKITAFFDEKNAEWGSDLKSVGWAVYINGAVKEEHCLHPNDVIPLIPTTDARSSDNQQPNRHFGAERPLPLPAHHLSGGPHHAPSLSDGGAGRLNHEALSGTGATNPGINPADHRTRGVFHSSSAANQHQLSSPSPSAHCQGGARSFQSSPGPSSFNSGTAFNSGSA